jgi:hypothetical protein
MGAEKDGAVKFAINWRCHPEYKAFITKRGLGNRKPFTDDIHDPDIKLWTTEKRAKVWLSLKDPLFASHCEIVQVDA